MEPPLGSQPCPLGLVQPLQAVAHKRAEAVRKGVRADHFSHPSNRPAPLILNRQPSREKVTTPFGVRQILLRVIAR